MIALGENQYGKSRVRVMKVERRDGGMHEVYEWNVAVWLRGEFSDCFIGGDNSRILPTDTMKNTVYSLARQSKAASPEDFAKELALYFLAAQSQVEEAGVTIKATLWEHIGDHLTAFAQTRSASDTVTVTSLRGGSVFVSSGFENLAILKTANSGFSGYMKDRLTTLKETRDRLFGTLAAAEWKYISEVSDFSESRKKITETMLNAFAAHDSLSVQQTLYAMGKSALETAPEISEIRISMPNKHCNLVDLSPFGQDNPNHIFVPTDEPHGSIEACIRRMH
jgi:urate oxidase